jgi:hypothetical protein
MLKQVTIDTKANGWLVTIPAVVCEANVDQQVKRFIEIADADPGNGHMHIVLFRKYHGGRWVASILAHTLRELRDPHIELHLRNNARSALIPFFEREREWHQEGVDADYGYPGDLHDLPI